MKGTLLIIKYALVPVMAWAVYTWFKILLRELDLTAANRIADIAGHSLFTAFLLGAALRISARIICKSLKWPDSFSFIDTLEHELTHALFGYLTLSPPTSLLATLESGGEVKLGRRNIFIALSPYFFPLWTIAILLLGLVIREPLKPISDWLAVFLLGNFFYRFLLELRWYQNDFKIYGRLFSFITAIFLQLAVLTAIMHATGIMDWQWVRGIYYEAASLLLKG